jgi:nucleotide-binding universal stress UspA family protein
MSTPVILLPVDGSEHATRATAYALKMVGLMGARVLLLHCHRPFPVKLGEPYFQNAIDKITIEANALLEPFRSLLTEKGVRVDDLIMEGPPGEKICDVARIENCEMIIMGSRGRSDLKGLLLGSVAHRVLQQSPCPVLVVR